MYVYVIVHVYVDESGYSYEKVSSIYRDYDEAKERVNELNAMCFPLGIEWYDLGKMWAH